MAARNKLQKLNLLISIEMGLQGTVCNQLVMLEQPLASDLGTYLGAIIKPVHKTRLWTFNIMAIVW